MAIVERERGRKSVWDQFCDFTSLVGFRLLHSKHPHWLRFVSILLMIVSTGLICLQTRYFWTKYVESKGQRIATVKETENQELQQPRFLVCLTLQTASLMHGYGSVDFRELVYRYQMDGRRQTALIEQLKIEISRLDTFFNAHLEGDNNVTLLAEGISLSKELRLLREIGAALSFDDAERISGANQSTEEANKFPPDFKAQRAEYRDRRNRLLAKCLPKFLWDWKNNAIAAHQEFIQCRLQLARRLYERFTAQQQDYFAYAQSVWMRPDELIVTSRFFGDGPGHWESSWQVDNGICALGGPLNRSKIDLKMVASEKNTDYILVKANRLEAHPNARIYVHLVYKDEESGKTFRANSFELIAAKNLEVSIRGISEIMEAECTNSYSSGCVPNGFPYSRTVCKWCMPETRLACPCANPDLYLAEFMGAKGMRNCSLLEAMECGPRQTQIYSKTECPNPCTSVEYMADYAAYDLTLEMLNISILEAERKYVPEQLLLIDKLNEFKRPKLAGGVQGRDTKVWKASMKLETFLADYYEVMAAVFRILYGSSIQFPTIFAEDAAALLGQTSPEFKPLGHFAELHEEQLELCGADVDSGLGQILLNLGKTFLHENFRKLSMHSWYPCPISISNENCRHLLNNSDLFEPDELAMLQQMVKWVHQAFCARNFCFHFRPTAYRQCTLELALTLNSTPANPICIVQFYSTEENLSILNNTIIKLRIIGNELLALLTAQHLADQQCQQRKIGLIQGILNSTILAIPSEGKGNNAWMERFRMFIQENNAMRLLSDFLTSRMALITFQYRGLTFQQIIYRDDYTLWELMSDVGGVLGLYFGLTIVTIYELAVFFTLVEREPAEAHRPPPEQLFTRRVLYKRDQSMSTDQPVPTIF